jgi:hypothetical protein
MPDSDLGNKFILTLTEYCSRYVQAYPIRNGHYVIIAHIFVDQICFRFGCPFHLLRDLGANLTGEVMTETCKLLGIKRLYTSPYHHHTDGLLERFHSNFATNL